MSTQKVKLKIISGPLGAVCSGKEIAVEDQAGHLPSSEVLTHANTLFDIVAPIDSPENGSRNLGQVASSDGQDQNKLIGMLSRLNGSSLDNRFDWGKLAAQFRLVLERRETYSTPGPESGEQWWFIKRSEEVRKP